MHPRLTRLAATLSCLAALVAVAGVPGAQAYTSSSAGSPGYVSVPVTQGWTDANYNRIVSFPERWVYRSPAYAGSQVVKVYMRMWRFNRSYRRWDYQTQGISSDVLPPQGVMRTTRYSKAFTGLFEDTYTTQVVVEWARQYDGALIARSVMDYNSTGDYGCLSSACSAFYLPDAGRAGLFFG